MKVIIIFCLLFSHVQFSIIKSLQKSFGSFLVHLKRKLSAQYNKGISNHSSWAWTISDTDLRLCSAVNSVPSGEVFLLPLYPSTLFLYPSKSVSQPVDHHPPAVGIPSSTLSFSSASMVFLSNCFVFCLTPKPPQTWNAWPQHNPSLLSFCSGGLGCQQSQKSSFPCFFCEQILDLLALAWSLILCALRLLASYHNPEWGDFRYLQIERRQPFCSFLWGPVETTVPPCLCYMESLDAAFRVSVGGISGMPIYFPEFLHFLNIWVALKVPKAFIFIIVMNPWYLENFRVFR